MPTFLIYGINPPPIIDPTARHLQMRDPRVVQIFLDRLDKELKKEDLYSRMDTLHQHTINYLPDNLQLEYEDMDILTGDLIYITEVNYRHLSIG